VFEKIKMFKKKPQVPKEVYLPTFSRVITIIHMSFAFSLLMWGCIQPFMGEHFSYQWRMALYKTVMGHEDILRKVSDEAYGETEAKLQVNASYFKQLPLDMQNFVLRGFDEIQEKVQTPFSAKFKQAMNIIALEMHPFAQSWIAFSLVICVMLLLRIEGASHATWILPFITIVFAYNNLFLSPPPSRAADQALFPSESYLTETYLAEPLKDGIMEQREQLMFAWKKYLVKEWSPKEDASEAEKFQEGEYLFTLERLKALQNDSTPQLKGRLNTQIHSLQLCGFIAWNLFFALYMGRRQALFHS
jgi:hypothetical protein